jgi:1-acyl-sn-glycerol-3-phosphate acyltransferase
LAYNKYGFFEGKDGDVRFDNVKDWDDWQLENLKRVVDEAKSGNGTEPLFGDANGVIWLGYRREPMKKFKKGTLTLYIDRIEFLANDGELIVHTLDEVHGINVQRDEVMEYYIEDSLFTFRFDDPWVSGYKWMATVNLLKGKKAVNADFLD